MNQTKESKATMQALLLSRNWTSLLKYAPSPNQALSDIAALLLNDALVQLELGDTKEALLYVEQAKRHLAEITK